MCGIAKHILQGIIFFLLYTALELLKPLDFPDFTHEYILCILGLLQK